MQLWVKNCRYIKNCGVPLRLLTLEEELDKGEMTVPERAEKTQRQSVAALQDLSKTCLQLCCGELKGIVTAERALFSSSPVMPAVFVIRGGFHTIITNISRILVCYIFPIHFSVLVDMGCLRSCYDIQGSHSSGWLGSCTWNFFIPLFPLSSSSPLSLVPLDHLPIAFTLWSLSIYLLLFFLYFASFK